MYNGCRDLCCVNFFNMLLNKGTYSVETSSVGVSTKATGSATNYSDSTNGINMTIMSAWTG